jgi:alkylated DNA repair dioxygenase AlkB
MPDRGLVLEPGFVAPDERAALVAWLESIHPIWEERHAALGGSGPARPRRLLRPVYWLGNWQFACLDYYRPPHGVRDRCVAAEPYPLVVARLVARIEALTRDRFPGPDLPRAWHLNTCLVNLYGNRIEAGSRSDCARVGEHRDFEPGPVASLSLGERALFQFVRRGARDAPTEVVRSLWLEDRSLLVFGGDLWKRRTLHRVLRVERGPTHFRVAVPDFETRRVNLTFRYVPDAHIVPYARLGEPARRDVRRYVEQLAGHAPFWAQCLAEAAS